MESITDRERMKNNKGTIIDFEKFELEKVTEDIYSLSSNDDLPELFSVCEKKIDYNTIECLMHLPSFLEMYNPIIMQNMHQLISISIIMIDTISNKDNFLISNHLSCQRPTTTIKLEDCHSN